MLERITLENSLAVQWLEVMLSLLGNQVQTLVKELRSRQL